LASFLKGYSEGTAPIDVLQVWEKARPMLETLEEQVKDKLKTIQVLTPLSLSLSLALTVCISARFVCVCVCVSLSLSLSLSRSLSLLLSLSFSRSLARCLSRCLSLSLEEQVKDKLKTIQVPPSPVLAWGWHGLTPTILVVKSKSTK